MTAMQRTATFLFTDLENSTPLWEKHPKLMPELTARHDAIMRTAIEAHRGQIVKRTGDGFHAIFETASDGVAAAIAGQQNMLAEPWPAETGPLRARMGLHSGESRARDGDYYGSEVNRAARVMGLAYGGQTVVSAAVAALIRTALPPEVTLADLGEHRLRGLAVAEHLFQLCHPTLPANFPPLKSLSAFKHNLPVQLSSFVGRAPELAQIQRLLQETHLLTLLGPGGTGKTRLMLESAEMVISDFADGVWLVELAPLTDLDAIADRVAVALNVQEQPERALLDVLVEFLRRKELLLLLDNVEHLVREAAELAEHLLTHCPKLKILVTGRESLFIGGEVTLQIPSLSLPAGRQDAAFEEIRASEGVQLFLARAQSFRPDFELVPENAATIAEIVWRLDGIPLALELAAARLRMLTTRQIADRLNDRFRLLTGGRRTALPRMQTLQALIDWSWNLLDEKERLLLRRLSVFTNGWSLGAAQAVTADEQLDAYDVFDSMEQLVNKSLVTVAYPVAGKARYGMLESIRQYSRDRLIESGEGELLRDRHADYFVAFAEEAAPHLVGSAMIEWTNRVILDLDNLRAVVAWTLDERPELALRIGGSLIIFETHWLHPSEAQAWLEPAIEKTRALRAEAENAIPAADFIKGLIGLTVTHGWQGHRAIALRHVEEAIELARRHDEKRLLVSAIAMKVGPSAFHISEDGIRELAEAIDIGRKHGFDYELVSAAGIYGVGLFGRGEPAAAIASFREAISLAQKINNPHMTAVTYRIYSFMAVMQGKLDEAKRYLMEATENYERLNDQRSVLGCESAMGHVLREEGNFEEAAAYYRRSIIGWQAMGQRSAVAHQVECFAFIALARGEHKHAANLLGAAANARAELNAKSTAPREIEDLARGLAGLAEAMGENERDKAMAAGGRLNLDEAVDLALRRTHAQ